MELTGLIIFIYSSITGRQLQLLWSACDAGVDLRRPFVCQRWRLLMQTMNWRLLAASLLACQLSPDLEKWLSTDAYLSMC